MKTGQPFPTWYQTVERRLGRDRRGRQYRHPVVREPKPAESVCALRPPATEIPAVRVGGAAVETPPNVGPYLDSRHPPGKNWYFARVSS